MKIAVVIPALDEAEEIAGAIESALPASASDGSPGWESRSDGSREESSKPRSEPAGDGPASHPPSTGGGALGSSGIEIVVVDGGSADDTVARAITAGARTLRSPRGRSRQLQAGVDATTSDVVLFLHADSRLPRGWEKAVREALAGPENVGGAFRFQLSGRGVLLRWIEWGVRLRIALFSLPYGDQGIFVRRRVLDAFGGVPRVALMEDLDLVHRMKRHGKLAMLDLPVTTSERRYVERGAVRTLWQHFVASSAWGLGVDRDRIAAWVRR